MATGDDWEREAKTWIAWARRPMHDAYWRYSPTFFETVPEPGHATLEIGCGEGRVARDLAARGHHVTGVDAAPTLVRAARDAHTVGTYVVADAARLPFEANRFDVAVAYNSLMDIGDMPGAIRETARVLAASGRLCLCVTHPFAEAGKFELKDADARFVVTGSYLETQCFEQDLDREGMRMTFRSWRRPLEAYARALEDAGLVIELLREPAAPEAGEGRWKRMPMFLFLRARKE